MVSYTWNWKVPALSWFGFANQSTEIVPDPPLVIRVAVPSLPPKQDTGVVVLVAIGFSQTLMYDESIPSQNSPFISIITRYSPGLVKECRKSMVL